MFGPVAAGFPVYTDNDPYFGEKDLIMQEGIVLQLLDLIKLVLLLEIHGELHGQIMVILLFLMKNMMALYLKHGQQFYN